MAQLLSSEQVKQVARLRFPQPLEREFWSDWSERIRRPVTIIAIAGLGLSLIYAIGTLLFLNHRSWTGNLVSAAAILPILVGTIVLARTKYWNRFNPLMLWLAIACLVTTNTRELLDLPQAIYERSIVSMWLFFCVIVIGNGLSLVKSAIVALWIIVGSYLVLTIGIRPITEPARATNMIVIVQAAMFAIAAAYVAEVRARREFLLAKLLDEERHKSEELLLNVLPREIAHRLKDSPGILAERHDDASVLFADLVGFTPYAAGREPHEIVGFLDELFSRFDHLVEARGLEKIKTVGDAYMVAGGVLDRNPRHLEDIAELAIEMREVSRELGVQLRIGIHTGPLVAGVIGRRKFLYDLWGDTVNVASRMESHGAPDHVHVSQAVAEQLSGSYEFESRGQVEIKGMGPAETYFLQGRASAAATPEPPVLTK